MTNPADFSLPPALPLPQAVAVAPDNTPCRKCSYDLRTLPVTGNCPECGSPVGVSIYGELLRFSDPSWVHKLAQGVFFILVGIFIIIGVVILAIFLAGVRALAPHANQIFIRFLSFCGNVFVLIGSWFVTEPDPSGIGEDKYGTSRKVIRVTLLLGVLNSLLTFVSQFSVLQPPGRQLIQAIGSVLGLAGIVGVFAQLQYFAKLALRIPDDSLSGRASFLKTALSVSYGLFLLLGLVFIVASWGHPALAPAITPVGCAAGILGIALMFFGILYLFMIDRFRRRFNEQAALARQIWGSRPPIAGPV